MASPSNDSMNEGFGCEFAEKPGKETQSDCPVCLQILREPYQATCCGKSYCQLCIERVKSDSKPCPACKEEDFVTFHNKGLQQSLYGLKVYCSHKQHGCEWKGELGQLDNHLNLCPEPHRLREGCEYSEIECNKCSELNRRQDIINKVDAESDYCPKCPEYCGKYESTNEDVKKHYTECKSSNHDDQPPDGEANHANSEPGDGAHAQSTGSEQIDSPPAGNDECEEQDQQPIVEDQDQGDNPEVEADINKLSEGQRKNEELSGEENRDQRQNNQVEEQEEIMQENQVESEENPGDDEQPNDHHGDEQPNDHHGDEQPNNHQGGEQPDDYHGGEQPDDYHGDEQQVGELERANDHEEQPARPSCTRLKIGVVSVAIAILAIMFYYYIHEDKCTFLPDVIQKCNHHCNSTTLWYECYCDTGYRLSDNDSMLWFLKWHCDGKCMKDINECSEASHQCEHVCHNTNGSYYCSCNIGYSLKEEDGYHCSDIDECATGDHNCDQVCNNTVGSYNCSCEDGYRLKDDELNCEDEDECATGTHECEHNCHNTEGSYSCSCNTGYSLNEEDGYQCSDIDECATGDHNCDQMCNNTVGSYKCSCRDGYRLKDDELNCEDINECDEGTHLCAENCHNKVGSYSCSCRVGYTLTSNGFDCQDEDECVTGTHKCEHNCHNTEGSYTCTCYSLGHFYLREDGRSCEDWLERMKSIPDQDKPMWFQKWLDDSTTLDILITGKTGTGKSTLINGLLGAKVIPTKDNSLDPDTTTVSGYSYTKNGVEVRVWDSPGLQDGTKREEEYIAEMKCKCHSVDFVFYCIRMDEARLYHDEKHAISKLRHAFGKAFWNQTFFILTYANKIEPPKDRQHEKEAYFKERLEEWTKKIQQILVNEGIGMNIETLRKKVIPAGFEDPHLPDRKFWLSKLWLDVLIRAEKRAQGSLIKINLNRWIKENEASEEEISKKQTHEQPFVSDESWFQSLWNWLF